MEANLIRDIKKGNKKSFKSLFDLYHAPLYSFGLKYIADKAIIGDIIQDVFVTFWEKRQSFDHEYAIKSFLYTSVKNSCLNVLKHEAVKHKHESSIAYELESEQYFHEHVISEEVFNTLYKEIKSLPASAQRIMLLALNGLKNQEIADELGISVNTVKSQKKIAYSTLKDKLSPIVQSLILFLY